ncbi:MAG: hypothetical protein OJF52_004520 [Nitrospira sp.]|nr:MAG: hypothetical protein OJF52_004520 [Nitrospira sp.]
MNWVRRLISLWIPATFNRVAGTVRMKLASDSVIARAKVIGYHLEWLRRRAA